MGFGEDNGEKCNWGERKFLFNYVNLIIEDKLIGGCLSERLTNCVLISGSLTS